MAQLIVRRLDEATVQALRRRAAQHGRSAEAEHREILREALRSRRARKSLKQMLSEMPDVGRDAELSPPRLHGRRVRR